MATDHEGEGRQVPEEGPAEDERLAAEERGATEGAERGAAAARGDELGVDPGGRRRFLSFLAAGLGGLLATAMLIPWVGLVLWPATRREPAVWRPVGSVDDFPVGRTVRVTYLEAEPLPWAGFAAESSAWLRRDGPDEFVAFTTYCTHVGCPVRWEQGAQLFMCPCHGGAFYRDGTVAAGPPIRPLDRYPVRVRNGTVELRPVGVHVPRRLI